MKIMVTGATGGYGQHALQMLKKLAPQDVELYGLVRNAERAQCLMQQGIHPRIGDYGDLQSLITAFQGIDRLLFVSVSVPKVQQNVVAAIQQSDLQYVAYTSLYGLEHEKFGLEINHRQTERLLQASGVAHTFLRDAFYLEISAPQLKAASVTGDFPYFAGEGRVAWALKREYAEAGARVILAGSAPEVVHLAGRPVTYGELGTALATTLKRSIVNRAVTRSAFMQSLPASGMSAMGQQLAVAYQDYALAGKNGEAQADTTEFERILGHRLTPLPEAIREVITDPQML